MSARDKRAPARPLDFAAEGPAARAAAFLAWRWRWRRRCQARMGMMPVEEHSASRGQPYPVSLARTHASKAGPTKEAEEDARVAYGR